MDLDDMAVKMEYYLEEYNVVSSSPMALVMFRYALDHISRCTRVLLQDNGKQSIQVVIVIQVVEPIQMVGSFKCVNSKAM